ncbi:MAG: Asp-tRNA(Asn) amidotransferase GatCAB subunit C [Candidatus Altiarchaeota archaeon]
MMLDENGIREQGIRIIEEFSKALKDIPETGETHYVVELKNVWREDGKPVLDRTYRDRFRKLVPRWEDNHVITEKG